MAKIKRPVSAILAVLMAASMLTAAPASAAEDASNAGAAASFSESVTDFSEETTVEETTEAETEEVTEAQKPQIVKEEEEAVGAATDISGGTVTLAATSYTYSGAAKKPGVTVKYGTKTLTSGTDYTVAYSNNTNVGTATVTVTGKGSYKGTKKATFKINAKKLASSAVTLKSTKVEYNGTNKATVTVKDGTKTLVSGTDYSVSYSNNKTVGSTATAKVTFKGNYTGTVSKTYTVVQKPVSKCTISLSATTASIDVIGNDGFSPAVTVKNGSTVLKEGVDYSLEYCNSTHAGSGYVNIIGDGNYSGTTSQPFTITKGNIANAEIKVDKASNYLYNDGVIRSLIIVKASGRTLKINEDYKITFEDDGDGIVGYTVNGIGDYTGSYTNSYLSDANTKAFASRYVWGVDNWSFDNTAYNFTRGYYADEAIVDGLCADFKLNASEKSIIKSYTKGSSDFPGACYGMSVSSVLAKNKILKLNKYTPFSRTNLIAPSMNGTDVCSFFQQIWYTRFSQLTKQATKCGWALSSVEAEPYTQKDYITRLEKLLKNRDSAFAFVYRIECEESSTSMSHGVVVYGYENYDYTYRFNNGTTKKYDRRLLISDPNYGSKNTISDVACIYYNSKDGSWILPEWTDVYYSGKGNITCYWNADMGKSLDKGSISSIMKFHSATCSQDMMSGYKFDYTKDIWDDDSVSANGNDENSENAEEFEMDWADIRKVTDPSTDFVNYGDVNGDGVININDVTALQNYLAELQLLSDSQKLSADVNGDGEITSADALALQFMIAELA